MTRLFTLLLCCWWSLPDVYQAGSFHAIPVRVELSNGTVHAQQLPIFVNEREQKAGSRLLIKSQTRSGPVRSYVILSGS